MHNYYSSVVTILLSTASAAVAAYDALFGLGVGTIEISNVSCLGNESDLLRCTNASRHCTHFRDAGVDCLGRPTRKCRSCV